MSRVLGLQHAAFGSSDPERKIAYYENILGLRVVSRESDRIYLATRSGADAVVISRQPETSLTGMAFQIEPGRTTKDILDDLNAHGVKAEPRSDPHPDIAESVAFVDLNGFNVELIPSSRFQSAGPARGVAPLRLGHLSFVVPDVSAAARFYSTVLGFKVGDWVGDFFVFLRCGHEHHTVNFIGSDRARMHHIAFEMQNSCAVTSSCDTLADAKLNILWGPVRHGPGHNIATYHKNPAGQIVELYAEMDVMTNEALGYYDPRPWHADRPQRPKVWSVAGPRRDVWGPLPPQDFLKQGI
jgi:catechol 2,3-dioxygenase-like lactoylglutathione lyase family enzyme